MILSTFIILASFSVEIWGTVADWVMIIVTSATFLYLVKTFNSQNEIKKIEIKRYIESIKPIFTLEITHPDKISSKGLFQLTMSIVIRNTNGIANNVIMDISSSQSASWNFWIHNSSTPLILPVKEELLLSYLINADFKRDRPGAQCEFLLEFDDEIGNTYRQSIGISITDKTTHIAPSIPKLIKNSS